MLVWALLVAVVRQLPGRAFAPVRMLAIVYTDVFRGVPAIIVIYLIVLGFGLAGVPPFDSLSRDAQLFWLSVLALVLVYGAYVAEVYRAGLESIHWSQVAAARSLGLSQWQTLRYVVIPQAVRRIIPPLLNDFVALQKDTALVSIVGVTEVLNNAQLLKNKYFNLSPVTGAALVLPRHHDPVHAHRRLPHQARPAEAAGAVTAFIELRDVHKRFGDERGAEGRRPHRRRARGRVPDRAVGLREVDAAALRQRARNDPGRRGPHRRRTRLRARRRRQRAARRTSASSSRASTSSRTCRCSRT